MFRLFATGKVVKEPYANNPQSGKKKMASVSIVSSKYTGKNPDGTARYDSAFVECVGFDTVAEALAKLSKGDIISVVGEPEASTYESKEGKVVPSLRCVVREWNRISTSNSNDGGKVEKAASVEAVESLDMDDPDEGERLFG